MKKIISILLLISILLSFSACSDKASDSFITATKSAEENAYRVYTPNEENVKFDADKGINYVNNMIMAVFKDETSDEEKIEAIKSVNGKVLEVNPSINLYQIEVAPKNINELSALVTKLSENDTVLFAYYDEVTFNAQNSYTPTDPWNGDVDESDLIDEDIDGSNWWMELIDLYGAWQYDDYFSKIKIGIIDTGFDTKHEDLNINIFDTELNKNKTDDHGTHVAGIIGAKHNNTGISGIVKRAELLGIDCYKNENTDNALTETIIYTGLVKLVNSGAKVINLSMGDAGDEEVSDSVVLERARVASSYMALLLKDHDFIVVQSAGNNNKNAYYNNFFSSITPENCVNVGTDRASVSGICNRILVVANIMTVHNKSDSYFLNDSSNYGYQIDIAAPGGTVRADDPDTDEDETKIIDADKGVFSTVSDNKYKALSGTSMSAPMVTGVCALVWSTSDLFTGEEVADIVISSAEGIVVHDDLDAQYSLLNAKAAVQKAVSIIDGNEAEIFENASIKEPIEYEIVRLDKSALDENNESTENYYYEYLVIKGDKPVFKELNELFYNKAEKFLDSTGDEIASYGYNNSGYSYATTTVTLNRDGLLGISITSDEYLGGNTSHARFAHYYYDLQKGKEATLDALVGIDEANLVKELRKIAWEELDKLVGDQLFPNVYELINSMQLNDFIYEIRNNEIYLEFSQYAVTDGTWGDIFIPTGLYVIGTDKE